MHLFIVMLLAIAPGNLDLPPEIPAPADTPTATAERCTAVQMSETSPPPATQPAAPSFASDCDEMSWYRARVGLPARFDQIGWRESNCRNEDGVHTSCCHGWWQLNVSLHLRDHRLADRYAACGIDSYTDVNSDNPDDKRRQACAAKALYDVVGLSAWAATS